MGTLSVDFDRAEKRCYSLRCVWQLVSYIRRFSLHLKEVPLGDRAGGGGNVVPPIHSVPSGSAVGWTGVAGKGRNWCNMQKVLPVPDLLRGQNNKKTTTVVRGFYSLNVRDTFPWNARVGVLRPNSIQFNQLHLQTLISFKSSKQSLEGMYP